MPTIQEIVALGKARAQLATVPEEDRDTTGSTISAIVSLARERAKREPAPEPPALVEEEAISKATVTPQQRAREIAAGPRIPAERFREIARQFPEEKPLGPPAVLAEDQPTAGTLLPPPPGTEVPTGRGFIQGLKRAPKMMLYDLPKGLIRGGLMEIGVDTQGAGLYLERINNYLPETFRDPFEALVGPIGQRDELFPDYGLKSAAGDKSFAGQLQALGDSIQSLAKVIPAAKEDEPVGKAGEVGGMFLSFAKDPRAWFTAGRLAFGAAANTYNELKDQMSERDAQDQAFISGAIASGGVFLVQGLFGRILKGMSPKAAEISAVRIIRQYAATTGEFGLIGGLQSALTQFVNDQQKNPDKSPGKSALEALTSKETQKSAMHSAGTGFLTHGMLQGMAYLATHPARARALANKDKLSRSDVRNIPGWGRKANERQRGELLQVLNAIYSAPGRILEPVVEGVRRAPGVRQALQFLDGPKRGPGERPGDRFEKTRLGRALGAVGETTLRQQRNAKWRARVAEEAAAEGKSREEIEAIVQGAIQESQQGPRQPPDAPEQLPITPANVLAASRKGPPAPVEHVMPDGTIMPGPEHPGAVPGSTRPAAGAEAAPRVKEPWQMTYDEVREAINPGNREELQRARPILAALFPEQLQGERADHDPWGIRRAVERGDELPRAPTVDLSKRHRELILKAHQEGKPVPPEVLADYNIRVNNVREQRGEGAVGEPPPFIPKPPPEVKHPDKVVTSWTKLDDLAERLGRTPTQEEATAELGMTARSGRLIWGRWKKGRGAEPPAMTFDQYSVSKGVDSQPPSFPDLHRAPGGVSKRSANAAAKRVEKANAKWQADRDRLRKEYDAAVERGKIRPPSDAEQLAETAAGEGEAAEAARRVIAKRAERAGQPEPPAAPPVEAKPPEAKKTVVKRQPDFAETGEYGVTLPNGEWYRIYRDKPPEEPWWYVLDHPSVDRDQTIGFTKKEAVKWLEDNQLSERGTGQSFNEFAAKRGAPENPPEPPPVPEKPGRSKATTKRLETQRKNKAAKMYNEWWQNRLKLQKEYRALVKSGRIVEPPKEAAPPREPQPIPKPDLSVLEKPPSVLEPPREAQAKPIPPIFGRMPDDVLRQQANAGVDGAKRELARRAQEAPPASPGEQLAKEADVELEGGVGIVAGPRRRIRQDFVPDAITHPDPEVEARYNRNAGASGRTALQWLKDFVSAAWRKSTRAQEYLSNRRPEFDVANEMFRLLKVIPESQADQVARDVSAIINPMGPNQLALFQKYLLWKDMQRAQELGLPRRFGEKSKASIDAFVKQLEAAIAQVPEVQQALQNRQRVVSDLVKQLVDAKILPDLEPEAIETYFHYQIADRENLEQRYGGKAATPKPVKRGFQKSRVKGREELGEEADPNIRYIESEVEWMTEARIELAKHRWLEDLNRQHGDLYELMKKEAKAKGLDSWEDALRLHPELDEFYPLPGNNFFPAFTIPEKIAEQLQKGILQSANVKPDQIRKVYAMGGGRPPIILPKEIVQQLHDVSKPEPKGAIRNASRDILSAWKSYTLFNPKRLLAYWVRNFTGDLDPVIGGHPLILKYVPRAIKDLTRYYYTRTALSPETRISRDTGVITSGMTTKEIPNLKNLRLFRRFYEPNSLLRRPANVVNGYFDVVKGHNEFREGILRHAAFLYFRDALQKGDLSHFGASRARQVKNILREMGVDFAAARLARDLLGDYGNLTVLGEHLRRQWIPFWSWKEVNLKRYPRMVVNAARYGAEVTAEGRGRLAERPISARKIAARVGYTTAGAIATALSLAGLAVPYAALWVWNNVVRGDEEDDLGTYDRQSPHLNAGRNEDGTVRTGRAIGALGDFLENFGINTALDLFPRYAAGQISGATLLAEMKGDTINTVVQGLRPELKTGAELLTGQSSFPDVRHPRKVEPGESIANTFGLVDEYRAVKGALFHEGSRARPHYLQRFFFGVTDPKKAAVNEMYELRNDFLKTKGVEADITTQLSPFRNIKYSAFNDDYGAFLESKRAYERAGKTFENFKRSLDYLDPVASRLNEEDEREFEMEYLNELQREKLRVARDYAQELQSKLIDWWFRDEEDKGVLSGEVYKALAPISTYPDWYRGQKTYADKSEEAYQAYVVQRQAQKDKAARAIRAAQLSKAEITQFLEKEARERDEFITRDGKMSKSFAYRLGNLNRMFPEAR